MTTLHISVLESATEVVQVLEVILQDIPESNRSEYVNQLDDVRHTALAYAINSSSITFIDILIRAGAEFDRRDNLGFTPLMDACHLGRDKVIDCLIDHGADVTATNNFNQSILENIMMGESHMKHSLLRRLSPRTSQAQLNRALWHSFNNDKEFLGVLVECGADAQYVGLSKNDVLFAPQGPETSEYMEGHQEIPKHDPAQTEAIGEPDQQIVTAETSPTEVLRAIRPGKECDESILVMMQGVCINDEHRKVDAWCAIGSGSLSIIRVGSPEMCKYILQKGPCTNSATLQEVSDPRSRISHVMYTDTMRFRHRKYGKNNIKGIVGVVVAERPAGYTFRKAPTTYVKIKWVGIEHGDAVLCPNGYSWITRSDLIHMVGQILANAKISQAWKNQRERYRRWRESST